MIDELLFSILNLKSDLIGNLNGDLKLSLNNIEHELIKNGYIAFKIEKKYIQPNKVKFNLSDIGFVEATISYEEEKGDIIFNSSNILNIKNNKKFAKKFQLNSNKVRNIDKIYFKIKRNINTGVILIFDIKINQIDNADQNKEDIFYEIRNSQELKSLVKRIINN